MEAPDKEFERAMDAIRLGQTAFTMVSCSTRWATAATGHTSIPRFLEAFQPIIRIDKSGSRRFRFVKPDLYFHLRNVYDESIGAYRAKHPLPASPPGFSKLFNRVCIGLVLWYRFRNGDPNDASVHVANQADIDWNETNMSYSRHLVRAEFVRVFGCKGARARFSYPNFMKLVKYYKVGTA
jgi:hypothetical protein